MKRVLVWLVALACASCAPPRGEDPILQKLDCPEGMVAVGGGPFVYGDDGIPGSSSEKLWLRGFCIDRYEHPNRPGVEPTTSVTWLEAAALCQAQGRRLCTEYEWEKAARGEDGLAYPYGGTFRQDACRYSDLAQEPAYRTGTHLACKSPCGAYDMSGGVWEWTAGPFSPAGSDRVVRGGFNPRGLSLTARSAYRGQFPPLSKSPELGLRCCWTPPGELRAPKLPEFKKKDEGEPSHPGAR
jgi:formylglycine-generating enzyme required for sulfatase activity